MLNGNYHCKFFFGFSLVKSTGSLWMCTGCSWTDEDLLAAKKDSETTWCNLCPPGGRCITQSHQNRPSSKLSYQHNINKNKDWWPWLSAHIVIGKDSMMVVWCLTDIILFCGQENNLLLNKTKSQVYGKFLKYSTWTISLVFSGQTHQPCYVTQCNELWTQCQLSISIN